MDIIVIGLVFLLGVGTSLFSVSTIHLAGTRPANGEIRELRVMDTRVKECRKLAVHLKKSNIRAYSKVEHPQVVG